MYRFQFEDIRAGAVPADWHERTLRMWTEDDALRSDPSAEHIGGAWERLVQRSIRFQGEAIAEWDGGDSFEKLYEDGWVVGITPEGSYLARVVKAAEDPRVPVAREAIVYVLDRAQKDRDGLGYHLGPLVESFEKLVKAEALLLGVDYTNLRARRGK